MKRKRRKPSVVRMVPCNVGYLRVQVIEETKAEAFMTAKTDDPLLRREQMTEQMRKSKRKELIFKRRQPFQAEMIEELE